MMKHGVILLALTCWTAGASFASDLSIPASSGMQTEGLTALSAEEMAAIEGGDLYLGVSRDAQMMTVTRVTPGDYSSTESYSVKVTTSVVRNGDVTSSNPKGAMQNTGRQLASGKDRVYPTQFPTGTANLSPTVGTQVNVSGPVIRTDATQQVTKVVNNAPSGTNPDSGYNIHYVDPAKSTNTLGCIGVQSSSNMAALVRTLNRDTASYKAGEPTKQVVSVSAYTNNTPPPASTFKPTPTPPPAPKASTPSSSSSSRPWWKLW